MWRVWAEGGCWVGVGVGDNNDDNNNNGHFYGALSLARSRAQCAVQKEAEKCISTYTMDKITRFQATRPEFTYRNFSK